MAKQPFRVLQVLTIMNRGGAESMVMNHFRELDRSLVQFDFLVHRPQRGAFDDEIEALGGRIFRAPAIRPWSYHSYFRWLNKFFKEHGHEFHAVHGHIQENSGFAFRYAEKYGIGIRVASSHIADLGIDYKYLFRKLGKIMTIRYATERMACGKDAGYFLFGKRSFTIFKNAIPTEKYLYSSKVRQEIREVLEIGANTFVIGNVARLCPQKNHKFILNVFKALCEIHPDALLLLVGEGPLLNELRQQVDELGITEKTRFLGGRSDVASLLQTFDVFFMPSLFEGLPVSVIEAQASGLPCALSETIDRGTDITGNVSFNSLTTSYSRWAEILLSLRGFKRGDMSEKIISAGYDVRTNLNILMSLYGIN